MDDLIDLLLDHHSQYGTNITLALPWRLSSVHVIHAVLIKIKNQNKKREKSKKYYDDEQKIKSFVDIVVDFIDVFDLAYFFND